MNKRIFAYLKEHQQDILDELTRLVELESPSDNKALTDQLGAYLIKRVKDLGAEVQIFPQEIVGDHILARWGSGEDGVLILCHIDTVWDAGEAVKRPIRIEGNRLYGVGAEDMKGGVAIALWALKTLREMDAFPDISINLLFTTDEETGSQTSREVIEEIAAKQKAAFVLEPAQPPLGSIKTSRRGVGGFRVEVAGRAVHAGADHEKGINAIDELAWQILQIRELTDYAAGATVNVGVMAGGTRSNVVPANAWCDVDVRVSNMELAQQIEKAMNSLEPHFPGTRIKVTGGFDRPPMVRTEKVVSIFEKARALAEEIGFELTEAAAGSASDGNFTAAMGIPTLDGMGVEGDGAHSVDEYCEIHSLPERAALLAALLLSYP